MKINELISVLKGYAVEPVNENITCDFIKAGDGEQEIAKVAVAMFATPEVLEKAAEYGANFLIVHEPVFYTHLDKEMPHPLCQIKKKLIEKLGITIFRDHDYIHRSFPDGIFEGQIHFFDLEGTPVPEKERFVLKTPMTALELAAYLENKLNIKHIRIAGDPATVINTLSCRFGSPAPYHSEFEECEAVITGEASEWSMGEYVRDYSTLVQKRALLVMGHINSEKFGMELLCKKLAKLYSDIEFKYFDCGDVYTYTK